MVGNKTAGRGFPTLEIKVKICGLTRKKDIDLVNKLLPDYVGFVFAESRRKVRLEEAKKMALDLNPAIKKVGVFADAPREFVSTAASECSLDILQFHGAEANGYWQGFAQPVWKALSVNNRNDLAHAGLFSGIDGLLLDSSGGGSGKAFDWNLARGLNVPYPLILAGGLNPENVARAIGIVRPHAVDVSSGVETGGVKDFLKIKQFIENVRGLREYCG